MALDYPFRVIDETSHFRSWQFVAGCRNAASSGRGSPFHSLGLMKHALRIANVLAALVATAVAVAVAFLGPFGKSSNSVLLSFAVFFVLVPLAFHVALAVGTWKLPRLSSPSEWAVLGLSFSAVLACSLGVGLPCSSRIRAPKASTHSGGQFRRGGFGRPLPARC